MEFNKNECIDVEIPKDAVEIKVTNMINPYFIRIYEVSNTNTKKNNLARELEKVQKNQLKKKNFNRQRLNVGANVIVSNDRINDRNIDLPDYICRGIVTDTTPNTSDVFFIDYGIVVNVPTESLVIYSNSQVKVEPLTLTVGLYKIVPVNSKLCIEKNWSESTLTFIRELFQVSKKTFFQILANDTVGNKLYGDFYLVINERNICLSKVLIRSLLAVPVAKELKEAIKSDKDEPQISVSYQMGIPKQISKEEKKTDVSIPEKKKTILKSKFLFKEKMLIQSELSVEPLEHVSDARFTTIVHKALENNGVRAPKQIQKYLWPAIKRGFNTVAIGEKSSGKTIGYLVPMISCVTEREENTLEKKKESIAALPTVVILCATVAECINITSTCKQLLYGYDPIKTYAAFNGIPEADLLTNILNKFNILISTPPFLVRLLENYPTKLNFSELSCLILDQADLILEKYYKDLAILIKTHKIIDLNRQNILQSGKMQIVAASETWTDKLRVFIDGCIENSYICVGSFIEAAAYCNVKGRMIICHSDNKMNQLVDIVGDYTKNKTMVFCINSEEAIKLNNFLLSKSFKTLLVHEDMEITIIEAIRDEWNKYLSGMYQLIICTDQVAFELDISNIESLIHYTVTNISKTKFNRRFFVFMDNWIEEIKSKKCKVTILFDETKENVHFKGVINILRRLKVELPKDWEKIANGLDLAADLKKKNHPICNLIKMFGYCKNNSCTYRHRVIADVDKPTFNISIGDELRLIIMTVHSASHFTARLVETISKKSGVTEHSFNSSFILQNKMKSHFANLKNKILEKDLVPGKICAQRTAITYTRVTIEDIVEYDPKTEKPKKVRVKGIDDGKIYEKVFVYDLYELPENLLNIQLPVIDVYLTNIAPFDEETKWTDIATNASHKWYKDNCDNTTFAYAKVLLQIGNCVFTDTLNARSKCKGHKDIIVSSLTDFLLRKKTKHGTKNEDHLKSLVDLCIKGGLTEINGVPIELPEEKRNSMDDCD